MSGPWLSQLGSTPTIVPLALRSPITAVTNLFSSPRNLADATTWFISAGALQTGSTIRYDGLGAQLVRYGAGGFKPYTLTAGHTYLHVIEARILSAANAVNYALNPGLLVSLTDGNGATYLFTLDNVSGGTTHGNQLNLLSSFNTYYGRFTALNTGTLSSLDMQDDGNLGIPFTLEYGFVGLYDITGLTGVLYDSVNNRYINLSNTIEVYGDSLSLHTWTLKGYASWPKFTQNGVGGTTSTQMLATFNANIVTTPNRANNPTIVWTGHNDPGAITLAQSQANITALTAQLTGDYRVFCTRSYNSAWVNPRTFQTDFLDALSDWIIAYYGYRAVDIRPALLTGGDGSAQDTTDIKWKLTPTSIRFDTIHPNIKGDELIGINALAQIGTFGS